MVTSDHSVACKTIEDELNAFLYKEYAVCHDFHVIETEHYLYFIAHYSRFDG